jgi:hypothetical protein
MFVGETGIGRIVERTCEAMKAAGIADAHDTDAVRRLGVIDLPTIQKKANLHFSLSLDLFGNEISTNAANAFHAGLKGRFREDKIDDDHALESDSYPVGAARRRQDGRAGHAGAQVTNDLIRRVYEAVPCTNSRRTRSRWRRRAIWAILAIQIAPRGKAKVS